jgi:nucleotide-binding universal stress UspA family protein
MTPTRAAPSRVSAILAATDFGETSRRAVDWAADLAKALDAKLLLAHVFDMPIVGIPDGAFIVSAKAASEMLDVAQAAMDTELARTRVRGIVAEGVIKQGDPREAIGVLAASRGVQLIVVGSHGRRGIARALLGSVAESILRVSDLPVIVVRRDSERPA